MAVVLVLVLVLVTFVHGFDEGLRIKSRRSIREKGIPTD